MQMECELRHSYDVKDAAGRVTATIVIGEVVLLHVHEGVAGAPAAALLACRLRILPGTLRSSRSSMLVPSGCPVA